LRFIIIESKHVNLLNLSAFGQLWYMPYQFGRLERQDIGKRLYFVPTSNGIRHGGILQMESDEQRTAREESRK
jgi:hypothetical protein